MVIQYEFYFMLSKFHIYSIYIFNIWPRLIATNYQQLTNYLNALKSNNFVEHMMLFAFMYFSLFSFFIHLFICLFTHTYIHKYVYTYYIIICTIIYLHMLRTLSFYLSLYLKNTHTHDKLLLMINC